MKKLLNFPNLLTLLRLVLTFSIIKIWFNENLFSNEIVRILTVVVLYVIAALTDYYDGYFARKYKERTEFGSFMDSLIDKIFTLGIFYAFYEFAALSINVILIHLIALREILITLLRIFKIFKKSPMITERHGKIKTTLQIIAQSFIFAVLLVLSITYETSSFSQFSGITEGAMIWNLNQEIFYDFYRTVLNVPELAITIFDAIPNFFLLLVSGFTVYSGMVYLKKNLTNSSKA